MAHFNPVGGPPGGGFPYDAPHQGRGTQRNDGLTSIGRALRAPIEKMVVTAIKNGSQRPLASIDYFSKMFEEPADNTGAAGYRPPQQAGTHPFPDGPGRYDRHDDIDRGPPLPQRPEHGDNWQIPRDQGFSGRDTRATARSHASGAGENREPSDNTRHHEQVLRDLGELSQGLSEQLGSFAQSMDSILQAFARMLPHEAQARRPANAEFSEQLSRGERADIPRPSQMRWSDSAPALPKKHNRQPGWLRNDSPRTPDATRAEASSYQRPGTPDSVSTERSHDEFDSSGESESESDSNGGRRRKAKQPVFRTERSEPTGAASGENQDEQTKFAANAANDLNSSIKQFAHFSRLGHNQADELSRR